MSETVSLNQTDQFDRGVEELVELLCLVEAGEASSSVLLKSVPADAETGLEETAELESEVEVVDNFSLVVGGFSLLSREAMKAILTALSFSFTSSVPTLALKSMA